MITYGHPKRSTKNWLFRVYVGDEVLLPSHVGITIRLSNKDPYEKQPV